MTEPLRERSRPLFRLDRRATLGALFSTGLFAAAGCGAASQGGAGALPGSNSAGLPSSAGATGGAVSFANPNLAVSAEWLLQHARDTNLRIVDARSTADYAKGHIPGAVSLPVAESFDPSGDRNYPDTKEKLEKLFGDRGIGNGVRVVTYDGGTGSDTQGARLFWTLEYAGHPNVSMLDGGIKAWQARNGELSTEAPAVQPAPFTSKIDPAKLPTKEQCELAINDKTKVVLDARSPAEYRGEDVRAKFGGHIPGAVNIDYRENFTAEGVLKSAVDLKTLYESKGVTKEKEVIAHCQTGQRSSVTYWVLRLLGYTKVGNYAGSWVEWGNDPLTPKA
jgi:thiosulfate/3-mercaptopyruvate sulfurtransferase